MEINCLPGGLIVFTPTIHMDDRGYFMESFNKELMSKYGITNEFVQDNQSCSKKNVARGFHFQNPPYDQAKLVRVVKGSVIDYAMDLRKSSKTYGQVTYVKLTDGNFRQFYIPRGFAHAFVALEDDTVFAYKCDNYWNKESEGCILFEKQYLLDTSDFIDYDSLIFSDKDKCGELLSGFETQFI